MSRIEWCDITINPVVGCSKCSPGCDNCYAERFAARMAKHPNPKVSGKYAEVVDENGKWTGKINGGMDMSVFNGLPRKPSRVFVGSMTDMFHPNLNDGDGQGMRAMLQCMCSEPQHTFMLLTKRPERMQKDIEWLIAQDGDLPPNLWLGVTVCNQEEADAKIPILLSIPAVKRFVSIEPMLGPVNLRKAYPADHMHCTRCGWHGSDQETESVCPACDVPEASGDNGTFTGWKDNRLCNNGHDAGSTEKCPRCGNMGTFGFDWVREDEELALGATIDRIREWEALVSGASKQGASTLFHLDSMSEAVKADRNAIARESGIDGMVRWSKTRRGGRQFDIMKLIPPPACQSVYGLCE